VRYQRKRWFATIRSELQSVGMAARGGIRDLLENSFKLSLSERLSPRFAQILKSFAEI
jgi:hypothetical protein